MNEKKYLLAGFGRTVISLGKAGEEKATRIEIDVSAWAAEYPDATYMLYVSPPEPLEPYFAEIDVKDNVVGWTLKAEDTIAAGNGMIELILMRDGVVIKSRTARTSLTSSPSSNPAGDKPHAHPTWWREALTQIETAKDAAIGEIDGAFDSEVKEGKDAITAAGGTQVQVVSTAGAAQISEIENKGKNTLASIPEEYADLDAGVKLLKDTKAPAIECEASGSIITVDDAAAMPVHGLVSTIKPVQSGSGDPSPDNVRPISGWDAVKVQRTGKNLANVSQANVHSGYYSDGAGSPIGSNARFIRVDAISVIPGLQYTISTNLDIYSVWFSNGTNMIRRVSAATGKKSLTFTTATEENAVYVSLNNTSGVADTTAFEWLQLELGSTATPYEPYAGQTLTAALPGTIYGGTLDWNTGVLTVDRKQAQIDAVEDLYTTVFDGYIGGRVVKSDMLKNSRANGMCDKLIPVASPSGASTSCITFGANNDSIYIVLPVALAGTTPDELNDYLAGNPLTVVYPLATPYTIQLTPQQLEMLKGVNNVWSDCGDTSLVYVADTKMYIDKKFDALAAALIG